MKKLLIISFDIVRDGECQSYAIGSLLSKLNTSEKYGIDFIVEWYSFNLLSIDNLDLNYFLESDLFKKNLNEFTHIAISCYIWNNNLVNPLIDKLFEYGFQGKIILGGYEISYSNHNELKYLYPKANYFIKGHAEDCLLDILTKDVTEEIIIKPTNFYTLPSPYLTNILPLTKNINKIRWETKRGCPYKCNFCAHRDLTGKKVNYHELDKIFNELALFKEFNVGKINILDPVFNFGHSYLEILYEAKRISLKSLLSLQTRPELVTDDFLDSLDGLNVVLEFGIQTMNEQENKAIKRGNNFPKIVTAFQKVQERNIPFEVSIIYGLPYQTVSSFLQSIEQLKNLGCTSITAFPLMLLKGTELYDLKHYFNFREVPMGKYNIPTVVESNFFSENEWYQMQEIALKLNSNDRI
jgi:radical SAM superfamily enzyme YgiQ (UPF0313 family)